MPAMPSESMSVSPIGRPPVFRSMTIVDENPIPGGKTMSTNARCNAVNIGLIYIGCE